MFHNNLLWSHPFLVDYTASSRHKCVRWEGASELLCPFKRWNSMKYWIYVMKSREINTTLLSNHWHTSTWKQKHKRAGTYWICEAKESVQKVCDGSNDDPSFKWLVYCTAVGCFFLPFLCKFFCPKSLHSVEPGNKCFVYSCERWLSCNISVPDMCCYSFGKLCELLLW